MRAIIPADAPSAACASVALASAGAVIVAPMPPGKSRPNPRRVEFDSRLVGRLSSFSGCYTPHLRVCLQFGHNNLAKELIACQSILNI
jgi:hypothetical protein